jgi:hypothetical protein
MPHKILESTILFQLLVGDMMKLYKNNIGSLETHGVSIGENWVILELLLEIIF